MEQEGDKTNRNKFVFLIVSLQLLLLNSCCFVSEVPFEPTTIISTEKYYVIQGDSIIRLPIVVFLDSNLSIPLDEIIQLNTNYSLHYRKGEKTWYEFYMSTNDDTLLLELYSHQYENSINKISADDFLGVIPYRNNIFLVCSDSDPWMKYLFPTNDTLMFNSTYNGTTIYYLQDENNNPEYTMVRYKYFDNYLKKHFTEINGYILENGIMQNSKIQHINHHIR